MKRAIYPGSFNPFHEGHLNVLEQACLIFDKVVVARPNEGASDVELLLNHPLFETKQVNVIEFSGLLVDYVNANQYCAIIRGLRNPNDFEYEKTSLYWNQDLGLTIPTLYFITNRGLVHISSSAVREVNRLKGK